MREDGASARWERLVRLLEPVHERAVATARRLARSAADGDDLYQEAVLRAFDRLNTLRDESRFPSWFYVVLLSRHRSRWRRSLWRRLVSLDEVSAAGGEPVGEDGADWGEEAWRAKRVARALGALAAVQREAVVLFEIDGYTIEEIAAMQRVSISAVKSRLARGRERLKRFYERQGWLAASEDRSASAACPVPPAESGNAPLRAARLAAGAAFGVAGEEARHE